MICYLFSSASTLFSLRKSSWVHYCVIQTFCVSLLPNLGESGEHRSHQIHRYDLGPLLHHSDPLIIKQKHCFGNAPADWCHSPQAKHALAESIAKLASRDVFPRLKSQRWETCRQHVQKNGNSRISMESIRKRWKRQRSKVDEVEWGKLTFLFAF